MVLDGRLEEKRDRFMDDPIREFIFRLKGVKWIAYFVVGALIIIALANFTESLRKIFSFSSDAYIYLSRKNVTDEKLASDAIDMSKNILRFVIEREGNFPPNDSFDLQRNHEIQILYILDTQGLFDNNYAPRIAILRNEFLKRGLRDKDLDTILRGGIKDYLLIALKLHELAKKI